MKGEERQSGKRQFALVKAYEISYAVFRVSAYITNTALKEHLERQALSLLDAATVENYAWVGTVARAIEYLVRFGGDVGLIHEANKETILFQLQSLVAGIAGPEKAATAEEVPLADIFAGSEPLFAGSRINAATNTAKRNTANGNEIKRQITESGNSEDEGVSPEMRQSAILDKIRQSGNCRMKDIQEVLPDCSERTIRYDLQALVEKGAVERIGSGGPSIFYRIRHPAQVDEG